MNLIDLSDQTANIINPIYDQLNDDTAVLSMFIEVLEKTTTEQAIFTKNKEEYEKKFVELKDMKKLKKIVINLLKK